MILWPLCFGWLLVLGLYKEDYLQIFKRVSFQSQALAVYGNVGIP